jgi:hypothetical protein
MPKVPKELPYQSEVLRYLKVLCLVKPCQCVWINECTSGMLLQEILSKCKGLIKRNDDLDLILKIICLLHRLSILIRVDALEATDNESTESLHYKKHI